VVTKEVFLPVLDLLRIPTDSNSEERIPALLTPAGALLLPMVRSGPFQQDRAFNNFFWTLPGKTPCEF